MRVVSEELRSKLEKGGKKSPFWIAGPCVIESYDVMAQIAQSIKKIELKTKIPFVFKASFDKANRTSVTSFRGLGMEKGLRALWRVKQEFDLPILTDLHESYQAGPVAEIADILQIPAFLCRQTDLIEAACKTGRLINVKKGQFLAPSNVGSIIEKLKSFGASGYWITERGVSFGYQRLVVDFAGFAEMERQGAPLIMDLTHSVQLPGAQGSQSGGVREAIPILARAAAAVGVLGFFAEVHPDPPKALSDSANAFPLHALEELVDTTARISEVSR